jgi:hypothetical protein
VQGQFDRYTYYDQYDQAKQSLDALKQRMGNTPEAVEYFKGLQVAGTNDWLPPEQLMPVWNNGLSIDVNGRLQNSVNQQAAANTVAASQQPPAPAVGAQGATTNAAVGNSMATTSDVEGVSGDTTAINDPALPDIVSTVIAPHTAQMEQDFAIMRLQTHKAYKQGQERLGGWGLRYVQEGFGAPTAEEAIVKQEAEIRAKYGETQQQIEKALTSYFDRLGPQQKAQATELMKTKPQEVQAAGMQPMQNLLTQYGMPEEQAAVVASGSPAGQQVLREFFGGQAQTAQEQTGADGGILGTFTRMLTGAGSPQEYAMLFASIASILGIVSLFAGSGTGAALGLGGGLLLGGLGAFGGDMLNGWFGGGATPNTPPADTTEPLLPPPPKEYRAEPSGHYPVAHPYGIWRDPNEVSKWRPAET